MATPILTKRETRDLRLTVRALRATASALESTGPRGYLQAMSWTPEALRDLAQGIQFIANNIGRDAIHYETEEVYVG